MVICTNSYYLKLYFTFFLIIIHHFLSKVIKDLVGQLSRPLKAQAPLEGVGFQYGFNANELAKVVKYWRDTYLPKWSEREEYLKKLDHYQTEIQG